MMHDPWTQPGALGQPALKDDSREANWWRIGVLDAERGRPPRERPWVGCSWPSPPERTRYLDGYRYKRGMMDD
jgi:hypothetical protein